jgi:hypothetical protein
MKLYKILKNHEVVESEISGKFARYKIMKILAL